MTSAVVTVAALRVVDAVDELRRASCAAHDSAGIIASNQISAQMHALLTERGPNASPDDGA